MTLGGTRDTASSGDDVGAVPPPTEAAPGPASPPAGLTTGDLSEPVTTPTVPAQTIGAPGRPGRPSLGWTELAVGAVAYVALQILLGALALLILGGVPGAPWLAGLSAISALGAVAVALAPRVRSRLAVGVRRVRPRAIVLAIGLGALIWVLSRVLVLVYVGITGDTTDPQEDLTTFTGPVAATLTVLLAGTAVPLGEELLFRGVLYGALHRYGTVLATLVSATLFGLAHGLNVVFPAAVALGVLNAMLYERTRSIWPSVTTHATFNLLSFGLLLAVG